jgi:hypothetical protein
MVNLMSMILEFKALTPKQRQAIPLLVAGKSGKEVASAINCNPATVSLWINHDLQFRDALEAFSERSLHLAQIQLESLAQSAVQELRSLLTDAKSEQIKLKAIELILSQISLRGGLGKGHAKGGKNINDLIVTDSTKYHLDKLLEAVGDL